MSISPELKALLLAEFRQASASNLERSELMRGFYVERVLRALYDEVKFGAYSMEEKESIGKICDAAMRHTTRIGGGHQGRVNDPLRLV